MSKPKYATEKEQSLALTIAHHQLEECTAAARACLSFPHPDQVLEHLIGQWETALGKLGQHLGYAPRT